MATIKQKNLARAIVGNLRANKPKNKKELLVSVGYDETTATAMPGRTFDQKGVQEELESLGFTSFNAKKVVTRIMNSDEVEPNVRLKAADMTLKVYGEYAPEKSVNVNLQKFVNSDPNLVALADEYEKKLRDML